MNQIKDYEAFAAKQQYLAELVSEYADIMLELDDLPESEYARTISEKIKSENFEIAVVGSFKNGKSTFINVLLGKEILPAYARPCTAIINEVRYAKKESAIIFLKDNLTDAQINSLPDWIKKELQSYDSETGISVPMKKLKDVLTIPMGEPQDGFETPYFKMILYTPLELLKNHVIITDTPGLNEIETRTRITTRHLSKADAIIMVFSADKLCSRVEMDFIEKDLKANGFLSPFFVINRMDTLRIESEKEDIKTLAKSKLSPLTQKGDGGIFFISALDALDAILDSDEAALELSNFPLFEHALTTYLIQERGRDKLLPSADLIATKLSDDVLADIIPKKKTGLKLSLQDAIIRQDNAQDNLLRAEERKEKINETIIKNSEIYTEDLSQMVDNFYNDLVSQMYIWVDSYQPKSADDLNPKKKAEIIQREILEYVSEQIKETANTWYQETYKSAVMQRIQLLDESIQNDLTEFLKELHNSHAAFFGDNTEYTADTQALVNTSLSVDSIVNSELTKNIGKSLGVALGAGVAIEILTGLMNPILGILTAIGAIAVGVLKSSQKIVPEIKEGIKKGLEEKLKANESDSSKKLKKETRKIFENYREQLIKALNKKFNQAKKEIDSVVDTLKRDRVSIENQKAQLEDITSRANGLLHKLQALIGDI